MLVLIKITYCRDGQLIWLGATLRRPWSAKQIYRFIWRYWVHCGRCTLHNTAGVQKKRGGYPVRCPSEGL